MIRQSIIAACLVWLISPAIAASPEMCRPYADATSRVLTQYAWLRSYTTCLNRDETPRTPTDWYNAMCVVLPDCQFAAEGTVPATDAAPSVAPTPPEHDAAWIAKCRHLFPRSFDAKTGTGIVRGTRKRVVCDP